MTNLKKCTPFGMQVKIALIKNNMTNQELAQKLGYTNSTISDVIFGRNLSQRTKERIAKELRSKWSKKRFSIQQSKGLQTGKSVGKDCSLFADNFVRRAFFVIANMVNWRTAVKLLSLWIINRL